MRSAVLWWAQGMLLFVALLVLLWELVRLLVTSVMLVKLQVGDAYACSCLVSAMLPQH